jgi:hypothetical protein
MIRSEVWSSRKATTGDRPVFGGPGGIGGLPGSALGPGPTLGTAAGEGDWGMGPGGLPLPDLDRLFEVLASLPGALMGPDPPAARGRAPGHMGPGVRAWARDGDLERGGGGGSGVFPPSAVPVPVVPGQGGQGGAGGSGGGTFV